MNRVSLVLAFSLLSVCAAAQTPGHTTTTNGVALVGTGATPPPTQDVSPTKDQVLSTAQTARLLSPGLIKTQQSDSKQ